MEQLAWNDSLKIGVDEVDKDHQHLVGLLNDLIQCINDKKGNDEIDVILDELLGYTSWHFRHEERLMQTYDYDGIMDHKSEHAALIEQAVGLQEKFKTEGEGITPEVLDFLKNWLTNHILGTDSDMCRYLKSEM